MTMTLEFDNQPVSAKCLLNRAIVLEGHSGPVPINKGKKSIPFRCIDTATFMQKISDVTPTPPPLNYEHFQECCVSFYEAL